MALLLYLAALLCKEAMVALPLALWICLVLSELKDPTQRPTFRDIVRISRRAAPLIVLYLAMALAHAARLIHWLQYGLLYAQGPAAAYDINPLANITGKLKYLYWALNLPDHLSIPNPSRNWARAIVLMGLVLAAWLVAILKRRAKLSPVEVGGLVWFSGMLVPPLLLSSRTAKWYLYFPAMGLALTVGSLTRNLKEMLAGIPQRISHAGILAFLLVPVLFSSVVQTRSFLAASDSAYQSDVLIECLQDFRSVHATLPPEVTLFFLPSFDVDVLRILASEPINRGQLFELYYPGSKVRTVFAHKNDRPPADYRDRSDVWILYYLDGHLYDVSRPYKQGGRLSLYFLPTLEAKVPPLMEKEPIGGWKLYSDYVDMHLADRGDSLPADYYQRADLMILQYLMGHFYDVTGYYKGRRTDPCSVRVIPDLEKVKANVSRSEFYPSYDSFGTPSGGPTFFPTPERDIVTQIGGSTAVVSLGRLPDQARLHFDISWMFDQGDGAWAEAAVRYDGREESLFRQYMKPNPKGRGFVWQEVKLDLSSYAGRAVELVLFCRNSPGNTTIADWLNWRDIRLESPKLRGPGC
jgi:hypothetical protein